MGTTGTPNYMYPEFAETETHRELWAWAFETEMSAVGGDIYRGMEATRVADKVLEAYRKASGR